MKNNILLSSQLSRKNNFDFLRFFLAVSVFISHYHILAGKASDNFWPMKGTMAVAGFFIISGFLITWSYFNNSDIKKFIKKRAKRIMPAYYTVIIVCALSFCLLSTLSYCNYFSSSQFFKYLFANLSFLNFLEPKLPGVFENNPIHAVNGSLWTLKIELVLYACVPIYCFLMKKMNKAVVLLSIYIFSVVYGEVFSYLADTTGYKMYDILARQFIGQLKYFISGALILFFFDGFLKYFKILICFSIIVFLIVYFKIFSSIYLVLIFNNLFPIAFAILIVGFAFNFKFLNNFAKYGDLSYGIYLIRDPVTQTLIYFNLHESNFELTLCLSFVITIILAFFSYHGIEKHFLKRR